jgi:DNA-directed RNA polymerase specialized sigma24 family protein
LRLFDGLSYLEIAAVVEAPEGTVKSRLNQARKLLRACLENHGIMADHTS